MKVKLLKPFCSRLPGHIVTMHPVNARKYAQMGICEALTDEEQVYLDKVVQKRGRVVETQIRSKATENTDMAPKKIYKTRTKTTGRRKS